MRDYLIISQADWDWLKKQLGIETDKAMNEAGYLKNEYIKEENETENKIKSNK